MATLSGFGDECEHSVLWLFGGRVAWYHMVISRVYKRPTPHYCILTCLLAGPNKHDILLGLLLSHAEISTRSILFERWLPGHRREPRGFGHAGL